MSGVCVIGDSFVDVVTIIGQDELDFSAQGDTLADSIGLMAGGSGLNTSFRIKELMPSLEVRFLSAVGTDQQGDMLEAALDLAGIEHTLLKGGRDLDGSTGCCIVLSANAKRSFITQRGVVDTFRISHFAEDTLASQALASSHIHCAGYFNCSGLTVMRGGRGGDGDTSTNADRKVVDLTDLFKEARDSGRTTSLNPQDDASGIWKLPATLLEQVTYLFGNEEELTSIATVMMNTESVATAGENTREVKGNRRAIAECFLASGCGVVVMTKGKDGVEAYRYTSSSSSSSSSTLICSGWGCRSSTLPGLATPSWAGSSRS
jgi:sugar/nucleoside kinase (ribokinase family)